MSREVKRVPVGFDWPLYKTWQGYLMPDNLRELPCDECNATGYSPFARHLHDLWYGYVPFDPASTGSTPWTADSTPVRNKAERNVERSSAYYGTGEAAIVREAERLATLFNGQLSHHLDQADVDALMAGGRLYDFTHTWRKGDGWQPIIPTPPVTAEQVNAWSIPGMGHDSINAHVVIRARCERAGEPSTCARCEGHGYTEAYPGQRAEAEAWERTEPPAGDGWQLWETTSEGSPISPAFATAEELGQWMSNPERTDRYAKDWMPYPVAMKFISAGWAPTFVGTSAGIVSGAEFVGMADDSP